MPKVGRPMGGVSEHCFGASPYFLNSLPNLTFFLIAYRTEEPETAAATRPFQAICISHSDGRAPPCGRYEIPFSSFRACYHGRRTLVRRPWYTRAAAVVHACGGRRTPPFTMERQKSSYEEAMPVWQKDRRNILLS